VGDRLLLTAIAQGLSEAPAASQGSGPLDSPSWETFFTEHGWRIKEIRFLGEESERLHRPVPLSPLDKVMRLFTSRPLRDMGYARIERIH
jgi:hypothetical protein